MKHFTSGRLAGLALLAALSGSANLPARAEPAAAAPVPQLQQLSSHDGVLAVTLEASEETVEIGGARFTGAVYNHQYAGPVMRLHPGELLKVHLVNHLDRPTNLHWHGIDCSPLGSSDNMHISVAPGESFDYEVRIPRTQPPGLYWYHDHTHGDTTRNVMGGLSGALVVEGFREQFPELVAVPERLLVLKDHEFEGSNDPYVKTELHQLLQTINGGTRLEAEVAPGSSELWRITNQSANNYFHLRLAGHRFRIIGADGAATRQETWVDQIDVMPASRVEALVSFGPPGSYPLSSEQVPTGSGKARSNHRVLGEVRVAGDPGPGAPELHAFPPRDDLRARHIDAYRTVRFSQDNEKELYRINDQLFDHARVDTRVPLGNVEEWTIRNETDDFHEFHIHQVSFQVVEIDGQAQPFTGYLDNVRVPERGEVKIRMAFTDPLIVGRFMYHCHVLRHEDRGMMANIEVYDPAKSGP